MTPEELRADRIRRLQERRPAGPRQPAGTGRPTEERHSESDRGDEPVPGPARRVPGGTDASQGAAPTTAIGRARHRAEGTRVATAGAGIVLALSLMTAMARADQQVDAADPDVVIPGAPNAAASVAAAPATSATSVAFAPAVPAAPPPMVVTMVEVPTHVVGDVAGTEASKSAPAAAGTLPAETPPAGDTRPSDEPPPPEPVDAPPVEKPAPSVETTVAEPPAVEAPVADPQPAPPVVEPPASTSHGSH